ncbi:small integral membrane protein 26-like [Sphaeramia orbicularis]|uniref:small integral membrane protein 26-like n=1 Tax=Sphaeramia orbicularis TaxID=375764 RepID=UPI00117EDDA2|nr:small integral membrane protein 26 [Sphaeramia orbicularis]
MKFNELKKWNTRASAVYAVGIWTMIGSYAYLKYTGKYDDFVKTDDIEEPEDPNQVVYQSPHSKTVIVYKKDFVPYTTRIYNFTQSFIRGPAPPTDSGK